MDDSEVWDLISWEDKALNVQQKFHESFGDFAWDSYRVSEYEYLQRKVGYALFGPPSEMPFPITSGPPSEMPFAITSERNEFSSTSENRTGYSTKQYKDIEKVCATIVSENKQSKGPEGTLMSIIFVCLEIPSDKQVFPVAVFRVPNKFGGSNFIDSTARVYGTWKDFLMNNQLPDCRYCVPCDGIYQADHNGLVRVSIEKTPAGKPEKKLLNVLDFTNIGVGLGCAAISVATLFIPVAGPVVAASFAGALGSGAYSIFRSSDALVDRAVHKQSIGLGDSAARNCWLSIAGSAIGTISMGATTAVTKIAQAGEVVSTAGRITTTVLNVGSVTLNGLGVVNGALLLQNKIKNNELSPLDVFQFTASVLFFTHSAITLRTADVLIKDTQTQRIQTLENNPSTNSIIKFFNKITRQGNMQTMEGRAKVIRQLQQIDQNSGIFKSIRPRLDIRKADKNFVLVETGHCEINIQPSVQVNTFTAWKNYLFELISKFLQKLANGILSWDQCQTFDVLSQQRMSVPQHEMNARMANIDSLLHGGGASGMNLTDLGEVLPILLSGTSMLYKILTSFGTKLHLRIIKSAWHLASLVGKNTSNGFFHVLEYVTQLLYKIASDVEHQYQIDRAQAEIEAGADFNQEQFDRNYGINERRFDYFCRFILEQIFSDPMMVKICMQGLHQIWDCLGGSSVIEPQPAIDNLE